MTESSLGGSSKPRIMVVDDENSILLSLSHHLLAKGYEVVTAGGGNQALADLPRLRPDLLILDLMMPDKNGLQVIREVRERLRLDTPIIVLSARGEELQKVEALDQGADDYLTKPFGMDELMARVRVALRNKTSRTPQAPANPLILGNSYLQIDLSLHKVTREGEELKMTPTQFELLKFLAQNADKLLTHRVLLQRIWGSDFNRETQYLHVFIRQLRQKIEANPAKPAFIITEPGLGYRFRLAEPARPEV